MNFTESQKREIQAMIGLSGVNRRGLVTSWQAQPPMVKVQFMPTPPSGYGVPTESGWIPVLSSAAGLMGNGWRIVSPPMNGAQAFLACEEGDGEHYVVTGFYYSDEDSAPDAANPGEILCQHESGAQVYLKNDGTIRLAASTVAVQGNLTVSGNVTAQGDVLAGSTTSLLTHYHISEAPGTPTSPTVSGT